MIEYAPERPGDVKHSVAGVNKIQNAGFTPVCDLVRGLRTTIEFFRKSQAGIEQGRHL
jgi:UDP-glucose 4-epimerase